MKYVNRQRRNYIERISLLPEAGEKMSTLAEKIVKTRKSKGLTQDALASLCGVTKRTVASYETDGRMPHSNTLKKLASVLGVTAAYLTDETADLELPKPEELYIENIRNLYGPDMAAEVEELYTKSVSLFAGGKLDQDAKDQYFLALTNAYIACKGGKEQK